MTAAANLPPALVVLPGGRAALAEADAARPLRAGEARERWNAAPLLVCHAALSARRLDLPPPPRSGKLLDVLELFAFVRPARFAAPSATGLALALGLPEPRTPTDQAETLRAAAAALLAELSDSPTPSREEALAQAETASRAGWAWGMPAVAALKSRDLGRPWRGAGLDVWSRLPEWEDEAPEGRPGTQSVAPGDARQRLSELLARAGLDEARPSQAEFAAETAHAFAPRAREVEPRMVLAEAGTCVGKTLVYLAPASLCADRNGCSVWVST